MLARVPKKRKRGKKKTAKKLSMSKKRKRMEKKAAKNLSKESKLKIGNYQAQ